MARKHVPRADVAIINLRLWQKDFQLAAHGPKFQIIKKCTRPEAGAIEDDGLGQTH
jgi:hypothetical protein